MISTNPHGAYDESPSGVTAMTRPNATMLASTPHIVATVRLPMTRHSRACMGSDRNGSCARCDIRHACFIAHCGREASARIVMTRIAIAPAQIRLPMRMTVSSMVPVYQRRGLCVNTNSPVRRHPVPRLPVREPPGPVTRTGDAARTGGSERYPPVLGSLPVLATDRRWLRAVAARGGCARPAHPARGRCTRRGRGTADSQRALSGARRTPT